MGAGGGRRGDGVVLQEPARIGVALGREKRKEEGKGKGDG